MSQISAKTWKKLNELTKEQLIQLAKLMKVGIMNDTEELSKGDLVLILSTEPEENVVLAFKKLLKPI